MKDPMKPLAPTMADELDNLERVRQYMSARDYQDYIEKRALEALIKYRKNHNFANLYIDSGFARIPRPPIRSMASTCSQSQQIPASIATFRIKSATA